MPVTWSTNANYEMDYTLRRRYPNLDNGGVQKLRGKIEYWASALAKKNQTRVFTDGGVSVTVKGSPDAVLEVTV
jgi:hypothetical protein